MSKRWSKFFVVTLLLVGCGGNPSNVPKACADLAAAKCDQRSRCTNGTGIERTWGSMSTCIAREELGCSLGLNAIGSGATDASVEACVAAFATYSCGDFLDNNPPAACIHLGAQPSGASCMFAGQCQSGSCNGIKTALCGTCGDPPAVGASCQNSDCARQVECVERVLTCAAPGDVADSCDNNSAPCGADLSCVGNSNGNPGTCMATVSAQNATCTSADPCDGTMGLSCHKSTCQPYAEAGNGAACGTLSDGSFAGCKGGECFTATGIALAGQAGTCKTPAADGAACDIILGPLCLAPARCVVASGTAGTCTLPMAGTVCGS